MRPKLQKQSALKLVGRIIPQLALGFHTRDLTANEKTITLMEKDYNSLALLKNINVFFY
jgi:hypothetical protein